MYLLDEELPLDDCDEILNNQNEDAASDIITHTSTENTIFIMPISNRPVNRFVNCVIIRLVGQYDMKYKNIFSKHNHTLEPHENQHISRCRKGRTAIRNNTRIPLKKS